MPPKHKRTTAKIFYRAKTLRHNQTPAEKKLWARLRNHQLENYGFRRQHAIGQFIVDFCCPQEKYVVELDGHSHASQIEYDENRTKYFEQEGWRVRRFTNRDVEKNLDGVLRVMLKDLTPPQPSPSYKPKS